MAGSSSLFERLDALADDTPPADAGAESVIASVRRHLRKVLNTRAGAAATLRDYGLTDFNDVAREHPDLPAAVAREVADLIALSEPRLSDVTVTPHQDPDDPTNLHFTVVGTVATTPGVAPRTATFDVSLGRGRRSAVR